MKIAKIASLDFITEHLSEGSLLSDLLLSVQQGGNYFEIVIRTENIFKNQYDDWFYVRRASHFVNEQYTHRRRTLSSKKMTLEYLFPKCKEPQLGEVEKIIISSYNSNCVKEEQKITSSIKGTPNSDDLKKITKLRENQNQFIEAKKTFALSTNEEIIKLNSS